MQIKITCTSCKTRIELDSDLYRKGLNCPKCQKFLSYRNKTYRGKAEGFTETENPDNNKNQLIKSMFLTNSVAKKYKMGNIVASGGMGTILNVEDKNLHRDIAMKVLNNEDNISEDDLLRFINEAQITSQLEHPSIIPVHELGMDDQDSVFYTMKYVRGLNLQDIIENIKQNKQSDLEKYSLNNLLNIFQKICDAVSYAHSKNIIHRDLKPENIMVGDYGEVLVMDWGLAKNLTHSQEKTEKVEKTDENQIESIRNSPRVNPNHTLSGDIMGTPGFMAPEQAAGLVDSVDKRSDVYALGSILYTMLVLRPPFYGSKLGTLLKKIVSGAITEPVNFNKSGKTFDHLPDGLVPESLSAVCIKSLSKKKSDRYKSVSELQEEIYNFQSGFATNAEEANVIKQTGLLMSRNKPVVILSVLGLFLLLCTIISFIITLNVEKDKLKDLANSHNIEKQKYKQLADKRKIDNKRHQKILEKIAPEFARRAKDYFMHEHFDNALTAIQQAINLKKDEADYYFFKGKIFMCQKNWENAIHSFNMAKKLGSLKNSKYLIKTSKKLQALSRQGKAYLEKGFFDYYKEYKTLSEFEIANAFLGFSSMNTGDEKLSFLKIRMRKKFEDAYPMLAKKHLNYPIVTKLKNNGYAVDISNCKIDSLHIFKFFKNIKKLNISHTSVNTLADISQLELKTLYLNSTNIEDLSPLRNQPLEALDINYTKVQVLTPLKKMKLKYLILPNIEINNLDILKNMPLQTFSTSHINEKNTAIFQTLKKLEILVIRKLDSNNLDFLSKNKLTRLTIYNSNTTNISALGEMPLRYFYVYNTPLSDFSALLDCPLEVLIVTYSELTNTSSIGELHSLKYLSLHKNKKLIQLNGLKKLTYLEKLSLPIQSKNIDFLKQLPNLKTITLGSKNNKVIHIKK